MANKIESDNSAVKMTVACKSLNYSNKSLCTDDWSNWHLIGEIKSEELNNSGIFYATYDLYVTVSEEKVDPISLRLYNDTVFTDFYLSTADGAKIAVHKAYLAAHSDVLKTMLIGDWKETSQGIIKMEGVNLQTLQHLKDYLYLGTLPDDGLRPLLLFARCYLIENLEEQCIRKLAETVSAENLFSLIEFACVNNIPDLAFAISKLTQDSVMCETHHMKKKEIALKKVVDDTCGCDNSTFAYVTDMGASAIVVYDSLYRAGWSVAKGLLRGEPGASAHRVGGVRFYWSDGVASAALSQAKKDGARELYMQPTSSTKTFMISTSVLMNRNASEKEQHYALKAVGDRGPNSQTTACTVDPVNNIMFFTQLNRNGISCWNMDKPFVVENVPLIISDCNLLEYPNDVKVDLDGNLWVLSDKQSRFLYDRLDFNQINFRVLTAPVSTLVEGSACAPRTRSGSIRNLFKRKRSASPRRQTASKKI